MQTRCKTAQTAAAATGFKHRPWPLWENPAAHDLPLNPSTLARAVASGPVALGGLSSSTCGYFICKIGKNPTAEPYLHTVFEMII